MSPDGRRVAFLRELTRRHDRLLVWKHLDRALLGRGDIDAAAPRADVERITADALSVAGPTLGATHVIMCHHVADKSLQFFVQPDRLPQLFEFDVSLQPSRGLAPWASPDVLLPLSHVRSDGIRSIRPGAEAIVSLVYHGLSPGGRDRLAGDEREIVVRGLATDLDGAEQACRTMPPVPARGPLRELVRTLSVGEWDPGLARRAWAGFVLAGPTHPAYLVRRSFFRARLAAGKDCVMSKLVRHHGRRVQPSGLDRLLADAREDGHRVLDVAPAARVHG